MSNRLYFFLRKKLQNFPKAVKKNLLEVHIKNKIFHGKLFFFKFFLVTCWFKLEHLWWIFVCHNSENFSLKVQKRQKNCIFSSENFSSVWFSGHKESSFDNSARTIPLESWIISFNFRKKNFFVTFTIFLQNASVGGTRKFLQQWPKHLPRVRWVFVKNQS